MIRLLRAIRVLPLQHEQRPLRPRLVLLKNTGLKKALDDRHC